MHTVFEEVGHNLMKGSGDVDEDKDGDGIYQHDAGTTIEHFGGDGITGMGINGNEMNFDSDIIYNDCDYQKDGSGVAYYEMKWSSCWESNWK